MSLTAAARQVLALGHHAHADHVVMHGDVPEPAFFRHKGNRRAALIHSFGALAAFVVGPNGHLVQVGVTDPPALAI
jgi:hypothetical protein